MTSPYFLSVAIISDFSGLPIFSYMHISSAASSLLITGDVSTSATTSLIAKGPTNLAGPCAAISLLIRSIKIERNDNFFIY